MGGIAHNLFDFRHVTILDVLLPRHDALGHLFQMSLLVAQLLIELLILELELPDHSITKRTLVPPLAPLKKQ